MTYDVVDTCRHSDMWLHVDCMSCWHSISHCTTRYVSWCSVHKVWCNVTCTANMTTPLYLTNVTCSANMTTPLYLTLHSMYTAVWLWHTLPTWPLHSISHIWHCMSESHIAAMWHLLEWSCWHCMSESTWHIATGISLHGMLTVCHVDTVCHNIYIYIYTYTYIYVHIYICICICIYINCMFKYAYKYIYSHMYTSIYEYVHVCILKCV